MLAVIKRGTLMIPAATLLSHADPADRLERGQVTHILSASGHLAKFDGLAEHLTRIQIDEGAARGGLGHSAADQASIAFEPGGVTRADDPMLLYFTSGTTSKPKLVPHPAPAVNGHQF